MVRIVTILITIFSLTPLLRGQEGEQSIQAGDHLWSDFVEIYEAHALSPLAPDALDLKAREALISIAGPKFTGWKATDQPTLPALAKAMAEKEPTASQFAWTERTLSALLPEIDRYGYYYPAADVSLLREALQQNSGKVHLTLERSPGGEIYCFPQDGGPAATAGITTGATLLEVDGRPTRGKSLNALKLEFVGPPGVPVKVRVAQLHGKEEEFSIIRTDEPIQNIMVTKTPLGVNLRIRKFDAGSAAEIKKQLEANTPIKRLFIDLRGNPGGVRDEALRVASMFFPKGASLGVITTNTGSKNAEDGNDVLFTPESIRILQDGRTISAAEYLIAILKEGLPDKVTLVGTKTYGKSQSIITQHLQGGGELALTEAMLATGSGKSWNEKGIEPDVTSEK